MNVHILVRIIDSEDFYVQFPRENPDSLTDYDEKVGPGPASKVLSDMP